MTIIRPIASLKQTAARRKPGYLAACMLLGKPTPDGQSLQFTPEAHAQLRRDFALDRSMRGLGDLVHAIAGPIGQALHWPCNQPGSADLKPGSPCDQARKKLNAALPFPHS